MAKYDIKITIDAESVEQANEISKCLQSLASKVNGRELGGMMKILAKNPQYIKLAKLAGRASA